jgi:salicylate hydroxylase
VICGLRLTDTAHAQGTAVALEDSAAFEILFSDLANPNLVEERLCLFEKVRLPRGALTQILSNAGPGRHALPDVKEEIRKFYKGPLPPPDALPMSAPFRDLFFGYDVFEETRKALM